MIKWLLGLDAVEKAAKNKKEMPKEKSALELYKEEKANAVPTKVDVVSGPVDSIADLEARIKAEKARSGAIVTKG